MRIALAWTILTLLAGACGESHLQQGTVIPPVAHDAAQCPAPKDIPVYTVTATKGAPGIFVKTNEATGLFEQEIDGHQKTRTLDGGKTFYIYRGGCSNGGYVVNYQFSGKKGSIKVEKKNNVYTSTEQFADDFDVVKKLSK